MIFRQHQCHQVWYRLVDPNQGLIIQSLKDRLHGVQEMASVMGFMKIMKHWLSPLNTCKCKKLQYTYGLVIYINNRIKFPLHYIKLFFKNCVNTADTAKPLKCDQGHNVGKKLNK